VLVYLNRHGLPKQIYKDCDLATPEDQLRNVIHQAGLGELDGNEVGPSETTLFKYGPEKLRA